MVEKLKSLDLSALFDPEFISKCVNIARVLLVIGSIVVAALVIRILIQSQLSSLLDQALIETETVATEQVSPNQKQKNYNEIVSKNIFGAIAVASATVINTTPVEKPVSKLPLSLVGVYLADGQSSYAIIENSKSKEQDVFMKGEKIFDEANLVKIFGDRVEISRSGEIETLLLEDLAGGAPGPGGVASTGENEFVIDSGELDKALENLPLLLQQARAVPYFKNGQSVGLRLFAIRPDSLYTKIGLRNGDILMSINGKSLADLSEAIKLFETMKQERSFTLVLERNRETSEFKYDVR